MSDAPPAFFRSARINCGDCAHFERHAINNPGGTCHGVPPTPILVGMRQDPVTQAPVPIINTYPPQITDMYWCGSAKARVDVRSLSAASLEQAVVEGEA